MKIALLGYGKMGKIIERVAKERGHSITLKADSKTKELDFVRQMYGVAANAEAGI